MKKILLILVVSFIYLTGYCQKEKFSEVKVYLQREELRSLAKLGIPVDDGVFHKEGYWRTILSEKDLKKAVNAGFKVDILKDDYPKYIETRNKEWLKNDKNIRKNNPGQPKNPILNNYPVPVHFGLGSMGGYYTLQEVMDELDSMVANYPNLVTAKQEASPETSIEGRTIYYVKISKNPNITEDEPKVMYNALIHAREPEGMQQLIFYMWYLLENYGTDPEVTYLVDNLEMYFIPVMNPDGYEYNLTTYPYGGGPWRKNRRDNGSGLFGVDLNRNFGYKWGYDEIGSSSYPGDETYRGTNAFSEPETQIIRDFSTQVHFTEALNYHTYGDLFLFPWSYIVKYTADSALFMNFSDIMTRQNRYSTGVPGEVLYTTNGDINDWLYGEQVLKPKVFSFTPETGNDDDGFWPFPDRIIPLCQENMYQNIMMAHLALKYAETRDVQSAIVPERQGYFKFEFKRYGVLTPADYTVSITPLNPSQLTITGDPVSFTNPGQFQIFKDSIAYTLSPEVTIGTEFKYILNVSNGAYVFRDTVSKYFGPKLVVFQDSCNQFTKWISLKWNVTNASFYTPPGSITDSPTGNYSNNTTVPVTTTNQIDLLDSPVAVIDYWGKWNTERVFDYVQVLVSHDNGIQFFPKKGRYTRIGSANEDVGNPVYDGKQSAWLNEEILLNDYLNQDIKVRFTLKSDGATTFDGFYFDDLSVSIIDMSGVGIADLAKMPVYLSSPFPNPASGNVQIRYRVPGVLPTELDLIDSHGITIQKIALEESSGVVSISATNYPAGIYFYRLKGSFGTSEVKKLIVIK